MIALLVLGMELCFITKGKIKLECREHIRLCIKKLLKKKRIDSWVFKTLLAGVTINISPQQEQSSKSRFIICFSVNEGLAQIQGMCSLTGSCTLSTDGGLGTAYTMAHETGHK